MRNVYFWIAFWLFGNNNNIPFFVMGLQNFFPSSSQKSPKKQQRPPLALVTGATGRTGQLVTNLLLEKGFEIRIIARDITKAQDMFLSYNNDNITNNSDNNKKQQPSSKKPKQMIEFYQGSLGDATAIEKAFAGSSTTSSTPSNSISHVIFCAGGESADYNAVNYRGVMECAKQAAKYGVKHFVVISTAWTTRPYSIASLLFNSLYDSIPMACHYMGEQELRRYSKQGQGFDYVILRPGGLNSDENYKLKYPEAAENLKLTYQQGDSFEFLGPAGRPGMCRTQLAHAVVSAINVPGRYTVEVTGTGTVDMDDSTIYETTLIQDDDLGVGAGAGGISNEDIMRIHKQAVTELKATAIVASVSGVVFIIIFGWIQGITSLLALDVFIIFIWSQFFAKRQI